MVFSALRWGDPVGMLAASSARMGTRTTARQWHWHWHYRDDGDPLGSGRNRKGIKLEWSERDIMHQRGSRAGKGKQVLLVIIKHRFVVVAVSLRLSQNKIKSSKFLWWCVEKFINNNSITMAQVVERLSTEQRTVVWSSTSQCVEVSLGTKM